MTYSDLQELHQPSQVITPTPTMSIKIISHHANWPAASILVPETMGQAQHL